MNILEEIAAKTRERVAEAKNKVSLEEMKQKAESLNADTGFPFLLQCFAAAHCSAAVCVFSENGEVWKA